MSKVNQYLNEISNNFVKEYSTTTPPTIPELRSQIDQYMERNNHRVSRTIHNLIYRSIESKINTWYPDNSVMGQL